MEPGRRPPNRRDAEGRREVAPTWESLVDRLIREAMEDGRFDDLPFQGEPLPLEDDSHAGEWAMAYRMLKNAGVAPPWIQADKDVRALLDRRDALFARAATASPPARRRDRVALGHLIGEINAAIARVNAEAPTDRQHRRPLDPAAELERLDSLHRG